MHGKTWVDAYMLQFSRSSHCRRVPPAATPGGRIVGVKDELTVRGDHGYEDATRKVKLRHKFAQA